MAETQGIVVPFREEGKEIVGKLSAARDLAEEWHLLREAQRYTISVHAWQLKRLMDAGAVYEVSDSAGVYCVRPEFYDESVGLKPDAGALENLIA